MPAEHPQSAGQLSQPSSPAHSPSPHTVTHAPFTQPSPLPQAGEQAAAEQTGACPVAEAVADPPRVDQVIAAPLKRVAKAAGVLPA